MSKARLPYSPVKTMYLWSDKRTKEVISRIVQTAPAKQDIAAANYVRYLKNPVMTIVVIGSGDILSAGIIKALAQAFMQGKFTLSSKGEHEYVIR